MLADRLQEWPRARRRLALSWHRWLLGLQQRREGYPALRELIAHEAGLSHDEHIGCDEAGRFSLPRVALAVLEDHVNLIICRRLMVDPVDRSREACCVCHRTAGSCTRWAQLKLCCHWLCCECVERWEAAQRGGQERGGEIGDVRELEDEVVASLTECPMCRAEVIVRTEGRLVRGDWSCGGGRGRGMRLDRVSFLPIICHEQT